jgi:hypothetical protein
MLNSNQNLRISFGDITTRLEAEVLPRLRHLSEIVLRDPPGEVNFIALVSSTC